MQALTDASPQETGARMQKLVALTLSVMLFLAGSVAAHELVVEQGWMRAMPPTQRMSAAYMTLRNEGKVAVIIRGASMDGVADASFHETRHRDGSVTMKALTSLTVGPGDQLVLEPGGTHLMMMGIARMPAAGEDVTVCLNTSAGEHCVQLPVLRSPTEALSTVNTKGSHEH
jgi:copper(I)-binding protein